MVLTKKKKKYKESLPNQSINHSITPEGADFETYPRTIYSLIEITVKK